MLGFFFLFLLRFLMISVGLVGWKVTQLCNNQSARQVKMTMHVPECFCTALIVNFINNQNEGLPQHKYIALSNVYIFLLQETNKLWVMLTLLSGLSNKEGLSELQSRHNLLNATFLQQSFKNFDLHLNNLMALIHNKKQTLSFQSDCVHIINLGQLPSLY